MKKKTYKILIFALTFITTYLCMCFCIPGMRIKLEAEPFELFVKSIKHMALFKSLISLTVGIIIVGLVGIIKKKNTF